MSTSRRYHQVNVHLDRETHAQLLLLSEATGRSMAEIGRMAVREFLASSGPARLREEAIREAQEQLRRLEEAAEEAEAVLEELDREESGLSFDRYISPRYRDR